MDRLGQRVQGLGRLGLGRVGELAVRRAREVLGVSPLPWAHRALHEAVSEYERGVMLLTAGARHLMQEHHSDLGEMQYAQQRLAVAASELFAVGACVARTTRNIERYGQLGATREIDLTHVVATRAARIVREELEALKTNDDELVKTIASRTYADGGYPFDLL
jgi:acyl-CoA dehydrogenase family protein 9